MTKKKKIVVTVCDACPHITRGGGFGKIAYIPKCCLCSRELPYTEHSSNGFVTAQGTGQIPEWCPLEDN